MKKKRHNLELIIFFLLLLFGTVMQWVPDNNLMLYISVLVVVATISLFVFRYFVIKPVNELIERTQAILEGDLTQEVAVKAVGNVGILATTINGMTESLRNLVMKIKEDVSGLTEAATTLSEAADQSEKTTRELATTLEQASASTQEQNANIEELQATFEEIGAAIEEISASAQQASSVANKAIETSQDGVDAVQNVVDRLALVKDSAQLLQDVITKLAESSNEISEIVRMITHMADQTNLLALNAAIEAARAGEHGRGFAVVAEEVRKLAEESGSAAQTIIKIVSDNQYETQQAVTVIEKVKEEIAVGEELADKTKNALAIIMNSTREIDANSSGIAAAVEQQASAIQAMSKSVETIASAAQQIAAGSQQASAAVQEQAATADMLHKSSYKLQTLAEELQNLVGTFKTT